MLSKISTFSHFAETHLSWPSITSDELASFALLLFFVILSVIESHNPTRKWSLSQLKQSYRANIGFFIFNSALLSLIAASSLLILAEHYSHYGLLNNFSHPILKAGISFLLLDLLFYLWHKASHSFDFLWLFHRVHHNDSCLNVSTAFRIHFIELLIATGLKALYIIVLGVESSLVLAYEMLMMGFVMLHHTNIALPGEKWLGKLFITPAIHRVHHSCQRHEHDSNYGAILSLWDYLFGTLIELTPVAIGIKGVSPKTLWPLLKFGFINPTPDIVASPGSIDIYSMIAEAAYYKAEKRSFSPGYELCDWLEAETEILRQVYAVKPVNRPIKREAWNFFRLGLKISRPLLN